MFLFGAMEDTGERGAVTNIKGTHALGCIKLVTGERQKIDAKRTHVECNFARRLCRIGVY
jgi:hypothetical protein